MEFEDRLGWTFMAVWTAFTWFLALRQPWRRPRAGDLLGWSLLLSWTWFALWILTFGLVPHGLYGLGVAIVVLIFGFPLDSWLTARKERRRR